MGRDFVYIALVHACKDVQVLGQLQHLLETSRAPVCCMFPMKLSTFPTSTERPRTLNERFTEPTPNPSLESIYRLARTFAFLPSFSFFVFSRPFLCSIYIHLHKEYSGFVKLLKEADDDLPWRRS